MPLDVNTAAVLLWYRGAEGQTPDDVTAVDGVFAGLVGHWDYLASIAVLSGQAPRA